MPAGRLTRRRLVAQQLAAIDGAARSDGFALDRHQREVAKRLAVLGAELARGDAERPRGVFLHGPPGSGKSWLAGAALEAAPVSAKLRVHSHEFFDRLHRRIHELRGEPDAAETAARDLVGSARLVLFDELHLHDAGNAILLTRVLAALEGRTTLLATSNDAPEQLLPDPTWHHLFASGAAALGRTLDVIRLDPGRDYREAAGHRPGGFPSGRWTVAAARPGAPGVELVVDGRRFEVESAEEELTIAFAQLCEEPTSSIEFLRWAAEFPRWRIVAVPSPETIEPDAWQRFVDVMDVLVDRDVPTTIECAIGLDEFVHRAGARTELARLLSRLRLLSG